MFVSFLRFLITDGLHRHGFLCISLERNKLLYYNVPDIQHSKLPRQRSEKLIKLSTLISLGNSNAFIFYAIAGECEERKSFRIQFISIEGDFHFLTFASRFSYHCFFFFSSSHLSQSVRDICINLVCVSFTVNFC